MLLILYVYTCIYTYYCMFVPVYALILVCLHLYMHLLLYVCTCICTYYCMFAPGFAITDVCLQLHMYTQQIMFAPICALSRVCLHLDLHSLMYVCACMYTYCCMLCLHLYLQYIYIALTFAPVLRGNCSILIVRWTTDQQVKRSIQAAPGARFITKFISCAQVVAGPVQSYSTESWEKHSFIQCACPFLGIRTNNTGSRRR